MAKKNITYSIGIAFAFLIGSAAALLTSNNMDIYSSIESPPLSPPGIVFPIVWTLLYILMGISSARVYIKNNYSWSSALSVYVASLVVNFLWSIIFFNLNEFLFSFIWLLLLWVLIVITIKLYKKIDSISAYIQLPYLIWVSFAGYLNFGIYLLNK